MPVNKARNVRDRDSLPAGRRSATSGCRVNISRAVARPWNSQGEAACSRNDRHRTHGEGHLDGGCAVLPGGGHHGAHLRHGDPPQHHHGAQPVPCTRSRTATPFVVICRPTSRAWCVAHISSTRPSCWRSAAPCLLPVLVIFSFAATFFGVRHMPGAALLFSLPSAAGGGAGHLSTRGSTSSHGLRSPSMIETRRFMRSRACRDVPMQRSGGDWAQLWIAAALSLAGPAFRSVVARDRLGQGGCCERSARRAERPAAGIDLGEASTE